jgi:hypothetical protein
MNGEFEVTLADALEIGCSKSDAPDYFNGAAPNTKTALDRAKKEGLKVVYPTAHELQIDIDNPRSFVIWAEHLSILEEWLKIKSIKMTQSLSGEVGHYHITVESERYFNGVERFFLQAILGSDLKRELLGFVMAKKDETKPTLFLEKK